MKIKSFAIQSAIAAVVAITASLANAVPVISSVSFVSTQQLQTITLLGNGFGSNNPYVGSSSYIQFQDQTRLWSAGYQGPCPGQQGACLDSVTLRVNSWIDSKIEIGGFAGSWGASNYTLVNGDVVTFVVSNPQSGLSVYTGGASISTIVGVPEQSTFISMALGILVCMVAVRRSRA